MRVKLYKAKAGSIIGILAIIFTIAALTASSLEKSSIRQAEKEVISNLDDNGVITTGIVDDYSTVFIDRSQRVSVNGSFVTSEGQQYFFSTGNFPVYKSVLNTVLRPNCWNNYQFVKDFKEGSEIPIIYDPQDPRTSRIYYPNFSSQPACKAMR